jgi:glycosyltransferase involved in cell wall biosynthesis
MRIAYIGAKSLPSRAGADRVVEAIVQRLARRHDLTVYCSSQEVRPGTTYPGIELVRVPALRGKHLHATSLFLTSSLHALARRHFDLIHVHNVEACFVLPLLRTRFPVVATSHGQAYARDKWNKTAKALIRLTDWPYITLANATTSVSKPLAEYYKDRYNRTVHYIPNGVEESSPNVQSAMELLHSNRIEAKRYILFAAGRIIPTKGAATLLEAYRGLSTKVNLLIIGDSSQVPAYERHLRQLADSRVVFIPTVDKNVLLGLIELARLFVFPSSVEAMSMMLLEAASIGTPMICSDIPENTTILPQRALFFENGNPEDLGKKMRWSLQHPKQMKELGREAKLWVASNYHWDTIVRQYEHLYHTVLRNRQNAVAA